ncbi:hypothetical protein AWB81_06431 [Caballeronia arationis]|jgi:hypothetical protein|nr:hypothetical protein AWB81_06431 [Caballeronia arationis]
MEKALKAVGYVGVGFLFGLAVKTIYSGTFKYDTK